MICSECGNGISKLRSTFFKFCPECRKTIGSIDYDLINKAKKSTWEKAKPKRKINLFMLGFLAFIMILAVIFLTAFLVGLGWGFGEATIQ